MKLKFLPALAAISCIIILLLVIQACRKTDWKRETDISIKDAKNWWYGDFRKTTEYSFIDYESPLAPSIGSPAKKFPSWKRATSYSKNGSVIVELPLVYQTNKILLPGMQNLVNTPDGERVARTAVHRLVILKSGMGKRTVRTVTVVPSLSYARKNNFDISGIQMQKLPADFEGYIMIGGWDEGVKNIYKIEKDKYVKKTKIVTVKQMEAIQLLQVETVTCPPPVWVPDMEFSCVIVPTGDDVADQERCEENGNWTDYGQYEIPDCYDDGEGDDDGDPENDPCLLYGIDCGEPGGGNTTAPVEIINNVDNPCIKNSVDAALSLDCKNEITSFINSVFGNSQTYHIQFNDLNFVGADIDKDALTSTGPMADLTRTMTNIRFNNLTLNNSSREYIAATVLHEAVHAWIDYKYPNPVDNATQHNLMASSSRFDLLRTALLEMYPGLSPQDATDLTWGGMYSTIAFNNLPLADRTRITQTNTHYRNRTGGRGTPC